MTRKKRSTALSTHVAVRNAAQTDVLYDALRQGRTLRTACAWASQVAPGADYSWSQVNDWRKSDKEFHLAIIGAMQEGLEALEEKLTIQATDGYVSRKKYLEDSDGNRTGEVIEEYKIAHGLAMPLMQAKERRVLGERQIYTPAKQVVEHVGKDGGAIQSETTATHKVDWDQMDDKKLADVVAAILAGGDPDGIVKATTVPEGEQ